MITLDHIGFAVADYGRSKAFYEQALAPLGITLLMDSPAPQPGSAGTTAVVRRSSSRRTGSLCGAGFTSR